MYILYTHAHTQNFCNAKMLVAKGAGFN